MRRVPLVEFDLGYYSRERHLPWIDFAERHDANRNIGWFPFCHEAFQLLRHAGSNPGLRSSGGIALKAHSFLIRRIPWKFKIGQPHITNKNLVRANIRWCLESRGAARSHVIVLVHAVAAYTEACHPHAIPK